MKLNIYVGEGISKQSGIWGKRWIWKQSQSQSRIWIRSWILILICIFRWIHPCHIFTHQGCNHTHLDHNHHHRCFPHLCLNVDISPQIPPPLINMRCLMIIMGGLQWKGRLGGEFGWGILYWIHHNLPIYSLLLFSVASVLIIHAAIPVRADGGQVWKEQTLMLWYFRFFVFWLWLLPLQLIIILVIALPYVSVVVLL